MQPTAPPRAQPPPSPTHLVNLGTQVFGVEVQLGLLREVVELGVEHAHDF
jgi:hypothetical protein